MIAGFVAIWMNIAPELFNALVFSTADALTKPWTILTYPFVVAVGGFLGLVFLCLWVWGIGGSVERAPLGAIPGLARPVDLVQFPPTLIVNGDVDELRVSGELFAATLASAGVPVELAFEPGTEHGHLNRPDEPAASATVDRVAAWIARGFEPAASDARAASDLTTTT